MLLTWRHYLPSSPKSTQWYSITTPDNTTASMLTISRKHQHSCKHWSACYNHCIADAAAAAATAPAAAATAPAAAEVHGLICVTQHVYTR